MAHSSSTTEFRPNVLVVDDDDLVLELIRHQLDRLPITLITTNSSAEALDVLRRLPIAVLLCDLRMPQYDGNTVLAAAREWQPDIVSILITGMADLNATVRALNEGGIWKYLAKPWKSDELEHLVCEAVQRYRAASQQNAVLRDLAREITSVQDSGGAVTRTPALARLRNWLPFKWSGGAALQKDALGSRYRLGSVLGQGGTGTVFKAHDALLDMPVAVKVLNQAATADPEAVRTLKEEARIAMQLSHRHIVRLHNLQKTGRHYFLVMEYVEGRTFREILQMYGKLPFETVRQVVQVCADALSYSHRHNVVHKDLKPANLMLSRDGVLKIIDFGVACLLHAQRRSDVVVGTPIYMSPEQIRGEPVDARTDVYALGVIAYQLLTGHTPLPETTLDLDRLEKGVGPLSHVTEPMKGILEKAVAPRCEDRWANVSEFAQALACVS
jgi:CheY-like chemotaxis protein